MPQFLTNWVVEIQPIHKSLPGAIEQPAACLRQGSRIQKNGRSVGVLCCKSYKFTPADGDTKRVDLVY